MRGGCNSFHIVPAFHIFPYYTIHHAEDENIEQLSFEERLARLELFHFGEKRDRKKMTVFRSSQMINGMEEHEEEICIYTYSKLRC